MFPNIADRPVIVITGGDNGLGYHMAATLLEDGYRVAVLDISASSIDKLNSLFTDQYIYIECDVTSKQQTKKAVETVYDTWGRIDILINNACIAIFMPFEEKPIEETRKEFDVNFFGYMNMIKAVLPYMREQQSGIIHNVCSGVGITGFTGIHGYCSTKGAIEALTRTLSYELEPYNIVVNLMHPSLMNTESASPLGIPPQMMDDAAVIGKKLARKVQSKKPVITPDFRTALYLFLCRRHPTALGRFMSKMTEKTRQSC